MRPPLGMPPPGWAGGPPVLPPIGPPFGVPMMGPPCGMPLPPQAMMQPGMPGPMGAPQPFVSSLGGPQSRTSTAKDGPATRDRLQSIDSDDSGVEGVDMEKVQEQINYADI